MRARLVVVSGPFRGRVFAISGDEFVIGRGPDCHLPLPDDQVSRSHCAIRCEPSGFVLRDLGTRNGTSLNGETVAERELRDGDRLQVGRSELRFEQGALPPPTPLPLVIDEAGVLPQDTLQIPAPDAHLLESTDTIERLPEALRAPSSLSTLLRISTAVHSIASVVPLQRQILAHLLELVPAERGGMLLLGARSGEIRTTLSAHRDAAGERPVHVSRTVLDHVLAERVAMLSNDVQVSEELHRADSLRSSGVRALLCVPMVLLGRVSGAIYLETTDPAARFDEHHLEIAAAAAAIAAPAIENAARREWLETETERLRAEAEPERTIIGDSPALRELKGKLERLALTDSTVLVEGESGTGKELVARALHRLGRRADSAFVAVNCAAFAEALIESELFGHERGAFTGAAGERKGRLELADGGTLFLDEVSELSPAIQAKLLRVLQEREFERVGGTRTRKVDVRVVAASNVPLAGLVAAGRFRADLYYRLNVVALRVPPLRERREDIPALAERFLVRLGASCHRPVRGLTPEALAALLRHDWPGNVRELANALESAVVLGSDEWIRLEDLPESLLEPEPERAPGGRYHAALREQKRALVRQAVKDADGNLTEAARLLGLHVNYVHRLIRNLELRAELRH